jgi:hypothetical protein
MLQGGLEIYAAELCCGRCFAQGDRKPLSLFSRTLKANNALALALDYRF